MRKLMLMSVLFATPIIPMITAGDANATRGMRRTVILFFVFVALWVFCLRQFYFMFPNTVAAE